MIEGLGPESCVLDASVAVASVRPNEVSHARARARVEGLIAANDTLIVPALFDAEFVSALVRREVPFASALTALGHFRCHKVVLGPRGMQGILGVITATRLRAADATYVWVALRAKLPLVTDDAEILARAANVGVVAVRA